MLANLNQNNNSYTYYFFLKVSFCHRHNSNRNTNTTRRMKITTTFHGYFCFCFEQSARLNANAIGWQMDHNTLTQWKEWKKQQQLRIVMIHFFDGLFHRFWCSACNSFVVRVRAAFVWFLLHIFAFVTHLTVSWPSRNAFRTS